MINPIQGFHQSRGRENQVAGISVYSHVNIFEPMRPFYMKTRAHRRLTRSIRVYQRYSNHGQTAPRARFMASLLLFISSSLNITIVLLQKWTQL